jgi:hypothetical protein
MGGWDGWGRTLWLTYSHFSTVSLGVIPNEIRAFFGKIVSWVTNHALYAGQGSQYLAVLTRYPKADAPRSTPEIQGSPDSQVDQHHLATVSN